MKISYKFLIKYIGNKKFCSRAEAFELAAALDCVDRPIYLDIFEKVFNREDVSARDILNFSKKFERAEIWSLVLKTGKVVEGLRYLLTLDDITSLLQEVKDVDLWEVMVKMRNDLDEYVSSFWPEEALDFAKKVDSLALWEKILNREDVIEYLNS